MTDKERENFNKCIEYYEKCIAEIKEELAKPEPKPLIEQAWEHGRWDAESGRRILREQNLDLITMDNKIIAYLPDPKLVKPLVGLPGLVKAVKSHIDLPTKGKQDAILTALEAMEGGE